VIRRLFSHVLLAVAVLGPCHSVFAQDANASTPASTTPRWSVEVHAGISSPQNQSNGSGVLPTTGTLLQGQISASTFYFGEGASLFNANQRTVAGAQSPVIVPLDGALVSAMTTRKPGPAFGVRLERAIKERFAVQVSGDLTLDHLEYTPEALAAIESTRTSYIPALQRALTASPLTSSVTSVSTLTDHQRATQAFATGAFVVKLRTSGKTIPYIDGGGGVVLNGGNTPQASLVGNYTLNNPAQLLGTDTVAITFSQENWTEVGVFGGGFTHDVTSKWGIRVDASEYLFKNTGETDIAVTPTLGFQSIGQPFPLVNAGSLKFATTAPLSGAPVTASPTFTSSGLQGHLIVSAGFFLRF
jgi:hypothetical protein